MTENRKIKNATPKTVDGIEMKSKAEVMTYETLKAYGFNPKYEEKTFVLEEGFRPTVRFYDLDKTRHLKLNMDKVRDITYTPDFVFMCNDIEVIVEVKGFQNDVYPVKKKLFRKHLETLDYPVIYVEIHSKRQLKEFIAELNSIKDDYRSKRETGKCKSCTS